MSKELQDLDCNCNNCKFFQRDIEKTKINNTNPQIVEFKIHYGFCQQFNKEVKAVANILLLHTQICFKNRRD